jgi:aspartyl-tRNA(Asn)/glutamyl-tRNA(Gln) amidotransferase subunit A
LFSFRSIKNYLAFLADNPNGCTMAVNHYLSEIKKNKHLNSFLEVFSEEALQQAKFLDEKRKSGEKPGKLHGVIISLKDVISYKNHTLSAASKILENFTSIYNATVVEKLLAEDAIIIGRTNCDEFAMGSTNENSAYGNVLNALGDRKVPGGSSGGSAVAVQAGMCMISLGSDTGGSVRQPADFCGIVGIKPTYGRISRYGLIAYASSFDQIGIFGKNIEDIETALEVLSGPDDFDSTAIQQKPESYSAEQNPQKKYRIAYFKEAIEHPSLDKEISNSIVSVLNKLKGDGHYVEAINFDLLDYIVPAYYVLSTAEASSNLSRYDGVRYGHRTKEKVANLTEFYKRTRSEGFGKEVKKRILLGTFVLSSGYYDAYYTKAQKVRRMLADKTIKIFKEFDVIVLPTSPTTAFSIGEKIDDPIAMYLADIYTVFANLTGVPAISVPLFKHSNGMPFGLQAMTDKEDELTLLEFSKLLMQQYKTYQHLQ